MIVRPILSRLVGEDGYVRDPSGQLALTQSGQKARGMEPIGKNLVIEDEGFSMRDFSDFVGILPETIGSIGGAIIGGGPSFGPWCCSWCWRWRKWLVRHWKRPLSHSLWRANTQDFG